MHSQAAQLIDHLDKSTDLIFFNQMKQKLPFLFEIKLFLMHMLHNLILHFYIFKLIMFHIFRITLNLKRIF
jgi:hypothetical protein